jgi:hypothetical protein
VRNHGLGLQICDTVAIGIAGWRSFSPRLLAFLIFYSIIRHLLRKGVSSTLLIIFINKELIHVSSGYVLIVFFGHVCGAQGFPAITVHGCSGSLHSWCRSTSLLVVDSLSTIGAVSSSLDQNFGFAVDFDAKVQSSFLSVHWLDRRVTSTQTVP